MNLREREVKKSEGKEAGQRNHMEKAETSFKTGEGVDAPAATPHSPRRQSNNYEAPRLNTEIIRIPAKS